MVTVMPDLVKKRIRMDRRLVENLLWPNTPWLKLVSCEHDKAGEELIVTVEGPASLFPEEPEIMAVIQRVATTKFYPRR